MLQPKELERGLERRQQIPELLSELCPGHHPTSRAEERFMENQILTAVIATTVMKADKGTV